MSENLRVLICEDHAFTRTGLRYSFQNVPGVEIVGEAENGLEAVAFCTATPPDIVLMDIGMPQMDGITATREIKATDAGIRIVMLTSRQETREIYAALAAGADAYCMKDITTERLSGVMATVMDGAVWLDPAIARVVASGLAQSQPAADAAGEGTARRPAYSLELTEREHEVLQYIAQGRANKDIAEAMVISIHTVKAHVRSLIQKLAVDDRTQAALKAVQEGLI